MKSVKSTSDAPLYAQLLGAFDSVESAYKLSKAQEGAAKHQLKTADKKEMSKLEEDVLKLEVNVAKHNRKAHKARLKIAQLGIKQWLKANEAETTTEEVVVESKKRGRKAKPKTEDADAAVISEPKKRGRKPKEKAEVEVIEGAEAPEPKKRGRKPKEKAEAEVEVIEGAEAPVPKKRGRKPKEKAEVEEVEAVEGAEAPAPKKRGRKPKPKEEVEVIEGAEPPAPKKRGRKPKEKAEVEEVEAVEGAEAPAPKKRGRQPKPKVEVEVVEATEPKRRGRPARIVAEVQEEEEGVAGASARAMLAMDEAEEEETVPKAVKPVKEPKAPKEPKPENEASDGKRGRRPSDVLAAEKAEKEAAIKAGLKGVDFRILEGIGPKVTAILHDNGIVAFRDLAAKSADELKALMTANRQFLVNPTTWARQAQLAADGKMDELEALKAELYKGKEKKEK